MTVVKQQGGSLTTPSRESPGGEPQPQPAWDFLRIPVRNTQSLSSELDRIIYPRRPTEDPAVQGAQEEAAILSHGEVQRAFLTSMDTFEAWEQSL